jgi:uncharacterized membrane protein
MLYTSLKFLHILLAIVAVGFNASYGIWIARAASQPEHLDHVLRGIKILDDRFANPAYGLLLVTGISMVLVGPWSFTTFWIAAALVLWIITLILGVALYSPTLRNQIAALETAGPNSPEFRSLSSRARILGIVLIIPDVLILFLMVFKPTL